MTTGDQRRHRLRDAADFLNELADQEAKQCELLAKAGRFEPAFKAREVEDSLRKTADLLSARASG